ncbi:MAG: TraB/GumN family protein [Bacteroidota bacterium]
MRSESKNTKSAVKVVVATLVMFFVGLFFGVGVVTVVKGQTNGNSLLWKVSGNGLEKPSYVFGTIHLTCEENLKISKELKTAFDNTQLTVLELDMDDPTMAAEMQKYSVNPGMANISDQLSEEDKETINTFFKANYGADLSQFGVVKPFFLLSMVLLKSVTCPTKSYEQTFVAMSQEAEREVKGLESVKFQTTLFDDIPQEDQIQWLTESISDFGEQQEVLDRMMKLHNENDMNGLFEVILQDPQFSQYADVLLYERNRDWISKMEEMAKEQPTFFAVGAGHLGSENGVIALLQKEGYTLEPVI